VGGLIPLSDASRLPINMLAVMLAIIVVNIFVFLFDPRLSQMKV